MKFKCVGPDETNRIIVRVGWTGRGTHIFRQTHNIARYYINIMPTNWCFEFFISLDEQRAEVSAGDCCSRWYVSHTRGTDWSFYSFVCRRHFFFLSEAQLNDGENSMEHSARYLLYFWILYTIWICEPTPPRCKHKSCVEFIKTTESIKWQNTHRKYCFRLNSKIIYKVWWLGRISG